MSTHIGIICTEATLLKRHNRCWCHHRKYWHYVPKQLYETHIGAYCCAVNANLYLGPELQMNPEHYQDLGPLSKQTVICFLVISHSCYRRFPYNLVSWSTDEKCWYGLPTAPVHFEAQTTARALQQWYQSTILKSAHCNDQHSHQAKRDYPYAEWPHQTAPILPR